eukprot:jgi/Botrbrau1/14514/Bobra.0223s0004.1
MTERWCCRRRAIDVVWTEQIAWLYVHLYSGPNDRLAVLSGAADVCHFPGMDTMKKGPHRHLGRGAHCSVVFRNAQASPTDGVLQVSEPDGFQRQARSRHQRGKAAYDAGEFTCT